MPYLGSRLSIVVIPDPQLQTGVPHPFEYPEGSVIDRVEGSPFLYFGPNMGAGFGGRRHVDFCLFV